MALFNSIWDDLKYSLRTGNMITKLVVVNFAVFVITKLAYLILGGFTLGNPESLYRVGLDYFCIPASLSTLLWQPWSILTHIFLHDAFWHLFNNLIGLYIFGSIVSDLIGDRHPSLLRSEGERIRRWLCRYRPLTREHLPPPRLVGGRIVQCTERAIAGSARNSIYLLEFNRFHASHMGASRWRFRATNGLTVGVH